MRRERTGRLVGGRLAVALLLVVALGVTGCVRRGIAPVQAAHGREFRCDSRYVRVEPREELRSADGWVSRGCGFEADWTCRDGACELDDARAYGMSAP